MKMRILLATSALILTPVLAHAEVFNGPYVGAEVGYEDTRGALDDGIAYGIIAGYNAKMGEQLVVGVEGKAALSTADRNLTADSEIEAGRSLGIAGRVGYLASPNMMFFGKVGYENVRTRIEFDPDPSDLSDKFNNDAVVLGGGLEYGLNPSSSVRVGYDYTDGEDGYRRHQVKAGVAIHF